MLHGSIVALVTPFRNGGLDEVTFQRLIEWHLEEGTHGFVPVGTTGESPTLSHTEHERVVELCIEAVAGRAPVVAGTGSNSTEEAISLTRHAKRAGADAALVVTPYYNKPTQEGLYAHYRAIHDAVDLPLIIYNIPGRSVVDMTPETMGRLARLPGVIGVKDATGDIVRPLLTFAACGADFRQLSGEDANALAFLAHGGHAPVSPTPHLPPRRRRVAGPGVPRGRPQPEAERAAPALREFRAAVAQRVVALGQVVVDVLPQVVDAVVDRLDANQRALGKGRTCRQGANRGDGGRTEKSCHTTVLHVWRPGRPGRFVGVFGETGKPPAAGDVPALWGLRADVLQFGHYPAAWARHAGHSSRPRRTGVRGDG